MNNEALHKKLNKKWLSVLLTICMVISLIPATAMADTANKNIGTVSQAQTKVTPDDEPPVPEVDTSGLEDSGAKGANTATRGTTGYTTIEEAGAAMRAIMVNRQTPVSVTYIFPDDVTVNGTTLSEAANAIREECFAVTKAPNEGDYLKKQYNVELKENGEPKQISASISGQVVTFTFPFYYYTTAEQEAAVASKIDQVLSSLNISGKSDYDKFIAIYDYICRNVTYDYDNLDDDSYKLKYTAYAALCQGTAVCQGYANLLYRMLRQEGIETRLISGTGNGGPHAWNIVKIGGVFYNVDSTWDSNENLVYYNKPTLYDSQYLMKWRLLSDASFTNHTRDDQFMTSEFYEQYPMSNVDYPHPSFLGYAIDLDEKIDLKYLVYIPDSVTKENVYVDFVLEDGRTEHIGYSDAKSASNYYGAGMYWYICSISPLEIADEIDATLHYENDAITSCYSAQDYCQYIRNRGDYDQKVVDIINALQNYGYYMQLQSQTADGWKDKRSHHAEITKYADISDSHIETVKSDVSWYAMQKPTNSKIDRCAYSITMNEQITINFYWTMKPGYSLNVDTVEIDGVTWYTRSISGILPYQYGAYGQMRFPGFGDGYDGAVYVLSYVNSVLTNSKNKFSREKQLAMVALYDYYAAVCRYVNINP